MTEQEHENQNDDLQFAVEIGNNALSAGNFAGLTINDLRTYGVLSEGEDFGQFVLNELRLNHSLQLELLENGSEVIPAPVDIGVLGELSTGTIFTTEEEKLFRRAAFTYDSAPVEALRPSESIREFNLKLLSYASKATIDGDQTFDPRYIKDSDLEEFDELLQQDPQTMELDGKRVFALYVPEDLFDQEISILALAPTVGQFIVVPDEDANHQLAQDFYGNRELVRYFAGQSIQTFQLQIYAALRSKFVDAALEKTKALRSEIQQYNAPIVSRLIHLLHEESEAKGPLTVLQIFRDDADVAAFKGEAVPPESRVGIESDIDEYTVNAGPEGSIVFEWEQIHRESVYLEVGNVHENREQYIPLSVFVRPNPNDKNTIQYGTLTDTGEIEWERNDEGSFRLEEFFRTICVITMNERIQYGMDIYSRVGLLANQMKHATTTRSFFNFLKQCDASEYPRREYIVTSNREARIIVNSSVPTGNSRNN